MHKGTIPLVIALLAHVPLGAAACFLSTQGKSFAAVWIVPLYLIALVVTVVTFRSLRPGGDGPRPALGVAAMAGAEAIALVGAAPSMLGIGIGAALFVVAVVLALLVPLRPSSR